MSPLEEGIMMTQLEVLKKRQAADDEINWVTASFMIAFHIGAVAALFFFTWKALAVAVVLWWVSTSLGIGVGYSRIADTRLRCGSNTSSLYAQPSLSKAARFFGWPRIEFTINIPTRRATRIHRAMVNGGHTWAGS
jgi:hypothetical protein